MLSSKSELRKIFIDYNNPFWSQAFSALELCSNYLLNDKPENYLSLNILNNDLITPTISFSHKELDFISLESLLNSSREFHSFEVLNDKFPKLFKSCLNLNSLIVESRRFLDIHLERNPEFAPSQTLLTIDYLTFFLTKKSKG